MIASLVRTQLFVLIAQSLHQIGPNASFPEGFFQPTSDPFFDDIVVLDRLAVVGIERKENSSRSDIDWLFVA